MILTAELHNALNRREWRKMIESARRVDIHESDYLPDRNVVFTIDGDATNAGIGLPPEIMPPEMRGDRSCDRCA